MKKNEIAVKRGGRLFLKVLAAGASILLASALLQMPETDRKVGQGILPVSVAQAEDLTVNSGSLTSDITWTFDPSSGTVTIRGKGVTPNYSYSQHSPFYKKDNIKKVVIESGITELGSSCFEYCKNLKSVTFPTTLTRIGSSAFYSAGLEKVTVPGSVQTVETHAFTSNKALTEIKLENGVQKIDIDNYYSTSIGTIYLPKSVTSFHEGSYKSTLGVDRYEVDPDNSVYKSVDGVLYDKSGTELIRYPGNRTGTFRIPEGVTSIESYGFFGAKLSRVIWPDSLTTVGENSFASMKNLNDVTITKNARIHSDRVSNCFANCTALSEIEVSLYHPYYTSVKGVVYSKDKTQLLFYPCNKQDKIFAVPSSVTSLDSFIFREVQELETIIFPDSLTDIEYSAIYDCPKLTHLVFPSEIKSLKGQILASCPNLKHLFFLQKKTLDLDMSLSFYQTGIVLHTYPGVIVNGMSPADYVASISNLESWSPISNAERTSVRVDHTGTLKPSLYASATELKNLTYVVRDGRVLSVSDSGVITPLKTGSTEVYACGSGVTLRFFVSVTGFTDVKKTDYCFDAVYWAVDRGITGGVKDRKGNYTLFDPQGTCTRAQMAAFLWRMAGCPEPSKSVQPFKDVKDSKLYYYKAVLWGREKGIIGGYSDNTFRPNEACSRSQAVTFLWRMAGCPQPKGNKNPFSDNRNTKTYYYKAVLWASENGITGGYSDKTFRPQNTCTRAQMVTFLYRYSDPSVQKTK